MNKVKLYITILLTALLSACFSKTTVKVDDVKAIKTVAVIMYTVPEQITYRENPRENSTSLLAALAENAIGKNGSQAADAAIGTFTQTLDAQGLPFTVMKHSDVVSNERFAALYKPATKEDKKDDGLLGKSLGFLNSMSGSKSGHGAGPAKMNQYGLVADWSSDTALTKSDGEDDYIKKAIKVLNVDAVLVVNDAGFSFSCEACIGVSNGMNGAASTGSAFNATLVTRSGPVMNIREWFATTDEQGAMLVGVVDPTEHKELFEEHGRKMAQVYAAAVKESLAAK